MKIFVLCNLRFLFHISSLPALHVKLTIIGLDFPLSFLACELYKPVYRCSPVQFYPGLTGFGLRKFTLSRIRSWSINFDFSRFLESSWSNLRSKSSKTLESIAVSLEAAYKGWGRYCLAPCFTVVRHSFAHPFSLTTSCS